MKRMGKVLRIWTKQISFWSNGYITGRSRRLRSRVLGLGAARQLEGLRDRFGLLAFLEACRIDRELIFLD